MLHATLPSTSAVMRLSPHAFAYEACDIPPGMTIREFRSQGLGRPSKPGRIALLGRLRSRRSKGH